MVGRITSLDLATCLAFIASKLFVSYCAPSMRRGRESRNTCLKPSWSFSKIENLNDLVAMKST